MKQKEEGEMGSKGGFSNDDLVSVCTVELRSWYLNTPQLGDVVILLGTFRLAR